MSKHKALIFLFFLIIAACRPATPAAGETRTSETDGMVQVFVPDGYFIIGSAMDDPHADEDEKPSHKVFLDSFWIDRTEVTNTMYLHCMSTKACTPPARSIYYTKPEYANHPAIGISWVQAQEYCKWAERRLPTEAEWEKAARGTDSRIYPWGNTIPETELSNFGHQINETVPVGMYPEGASPYGALDMAGNAWEWVADGYQPDFYSRSPQENPLSDSPVNRRVLRGGNWDSNAEGIRVTNRFWAFPGRNDTDGFRCAESDWK
ncbi:MAG: formylglycine-generating enzyme family protein [Anaerolineae bacterium]|nr:formylglycine-generating enzyme family protein [Anaerolineae bacterium]MCI0609212.1 formylglycine-generating enzyme family protein [Anaerolineae bacterium]